jgi:hypothetical protein
MGGFFLPNKEPKLKATGRFPQNVLSLERTSRIEIQRGLRRFGELMQTGKIV